MNRDLHVIEEWANHGTLRQFAAELSARLSERQEYQVVLKDNTIQVIKRTYEGGLLGIGKHKEEEIVLEGVEVDGNMTVRQLTADGELVEYLTKALHAH